MRTEGYRTVAGVTAGTLVDVMLLLWCVTSNDDGDGGGGAEKCIIIHFFKYTSPIYYLSWCGVGHFWSFFTKGTHARTHTYTHTNTHTHTHTYTTPGQNWSRRTTQTLQGSMPAGLPVLPEHEVTTPQLNVPDLFCAR